MPVDIAEEFANSYVAYSNDRKNPMNTLEWLESQPMASERFKSSLQAFYNEMEFVDADPILDAQDHPEKGFEVVKVDSHYVTLKGVDWERFKMVVRLAESNGKWVIDGAGAINIPANRRVQH